MLFVMTNSEKPTSELSCHDICFRKVSQEYGGLLVFRRAEEGTAAVRELFGDKSISLFARALSKEELQVVQMNSSHGSVKFMFVLFEDGGSRTSHHKSVHTIEEKA
jgi:hypothetical protein